MGDSNYQVEYPKSNQKAIILDVHEYKDAGGNTIELKVSKPLNNIYENITKIELLDFSVILNNNQPPDEPIYLNLNGWRNIENLTLPVFYKYDPNSLLQNNNQGSVFKYFDYSIGKITNLDINLYKMDTNNLLVPFTTNTNFKLNMVIKLFQKDGVYLY